MSENADNRLPKYSDNCTIKLIIYCHMKNTDHNKPNPFKHFYDNELPAQMKDGFISLVCQSCEITYTHFYKWLNNPESIKLPSRVKIAQIAGKKVYELFVQKTKLQLWYHSISPAKKSLVIEVTCKKLMIDKSNFNRYLTGIYKNTEFNAIMADYSNIKKEHLHEPSEI